VKPNDLSRLDVAFFNVNGYVAMIVFLSRWEVSMFKDDSAECRVQGAERKLREAYRRPGILAALMVILVVGLVGCGGPAASRETLSAEGGSPPHRRCATDVRGRAGGGTSRGRASRLNWCYFPSALERDSAFVAGRSTESERSDIHCLLNKDGSRARIVRLAFRGTKSRWR